MSLARVCAFNIGTFEGNTLYPNGNMPSLTVPPSPFLPTLRMIYFLSKCLCNMFFNRIKSILLRTKKGKSPSLSFLLEQWSWLSLKPQGGFLRFTAELPELHFKLITGKWKCRTGPKVCLTIACLFMGKHEQMLTHLRYHTDDRPRKGFHSSLANGQVSFFGI